MENKAITIKKYIENENVKSRIEDLLKDRAPQFIVSLTAMVNNSEKLAECEPNSLMTAALTAAALNLPINQNLGFAYIIPYKDNKAGVTYAQFQMGYKGFIQLSMRSGQFQTLNVTDVREGELKGINRLSGELDLEWIDDRDKLPVIGYVAYFKLINGFEKSLYMTDADLKAHGVRFSSSMKKGFGLWKDNFDSMAKKTVIKLLLSKFGPMSTDMAKAHEIDQAVITDEGKKYIDNKTLNPEEESEIKERDRIEKFIAEAQSTKGLERCQDAVFEAGDEKLNEVYAAKRKELEGKK